MTWLKCPNGDVFEIADLTYREWGLLKRVANQMCPGCHRSFDFYKFKAQGDGASSTQTSNKAMNLPHKPMDIQSQVMARLKGILKKSKWWQKQASDSSVKSCYHAVMRLLMSADLTSNFPTFRIWSMMAMDKRGESSMRNMWAFTSDMSEDYSKERDSGEQLFFNTLNPSVSTLSGGVPAPEHRPVYTVLNVGRYHVGGAVNYGNSHVVYRDGVKLRATFTSTDTLQMIKGVLKNEAQTARETSLGSLQDHVAGIGSIDRILLKISDNSLSNLCKHAGYAVLNDSIGRDPEFIEGQVWGDLSFREDVKAIVLSTKDLDYMPRDRDDSLPAGFKAMTQTERKDAVDAFIKELKTYCLQKRIDLFLLPISMGMDILKACMPLSSQSPVKLT